MSPHPISYTSPHTLHINATSTSPTSSECDYKHMGPILPGLVTRDTRRIDSRQDRSLRSVVSKLPRQWGQYYPALSPGIPGESTRDKTDLFGVWSLNFLDNGRQYYLDYAARIPGIASASSAL
ncbi:hypothetical protein BGAL_0266g00040 [Botrytis galanthina]|uniref:Uncharacterized protein n=1 Tax=Botrytis galanthina TaxID=278940 RepID=A0A4S8R239_9HELO|nr:hypothetical protein BGAL_0266g00040 [Botrytis galanthina]